jgi:hypothetical protein
VYVLSIYRAWVLSTIEKGKTFMNILASSFSVFFLMIMHDNENDNNHDEDMVLETLDGRCVECGHEAVQAAWTHNAFAQHQATVISTRMTAAAAPHPHPHPHPHHSHPAPLSSSLEELPLFDQVQARMYAQSHVAEVLAVSPYGLIPGQEEDVLQRCSMAQLDALEDLHYQVRRSSEL